MTGKYPKATLFGLGVALGLAIWIFSPQLTGKGEPWDADAPIWQTSWAVLAVCGGLTGRVRGICLPLGYAAGQMLWTAGSVAAGQFGALAWMFIGGYAVVATAATLAVAGVRAWLLPWVGTWLRSPRS